MFPILPEYDGKHVPKDIRDRRWEEAPEEQKRPLPASGNKKIVETELLMRGNESRGRSCCKAFLPGLP
jgi:hypothetical protein